MNLAWNTMLLKQNLSGIGNYIERILYEFEKEDIKNNLLLFGSENEYDYRKINLESNTSLTNSIFSKKKFLRVLWEQIFLPIKAKKNNINLIHCPAHVVPLMSSMKTIVTIHDLAFKLFPETFKWQNRSYLNFIVPLSIKKADKVIAVSKNTKKDIIREYNVNPNKIKVIYNGVDEKYRRINDDEIINKIKEKYKLPKDFILYLGTLEPRKNIERLIKGFNKTKKNNIKLVIAGGKGWLYDDVFKLVKKLNLEEKVIFTGYIDEKDIVLLYNAATLFVYPSLYEGFGLPPLEAMACGTPVITSNLSSLPEVVGDAAITVNPNNVKDLIEAIDKVLNNKELQRKMIQKGLKRANKFTWKNTARETIKVYKEVLNSD